MYDYIERVKKQYHLFVEEETEKGNDPHAIFAGFFPCAGILGVCLSFVFPAIAIGILELIVLIGNATSDASDSLKAFFIFVELILGLLLALSLVLSLLSLVLFVISMLMILIAPITSCLACLAILGVILLPPLLEDYEEIGV